MLLILSIVLVCSGRQLEDSVTKNHKVRGGRLNIVDGGTGPSAESQYGAMEAGHECVRIYVYVF